MKYKLLVFTIALLSITQIIYYCDAHENKDIQLVLIDENNKPTKPLLELLALTGIEHDGSVASIVQATQKLDANWLRKEGTERWDIVDNNIENKDQFFTLFNQLDLLDDIKPHTKKYDYALWMGAAFGRAKDRLEHLVELWKKGIKCNAIILLAGARPLTDNEKLFVMQAYDLQEKDCPQTEFEMMQLVYKKIDMPDDMRNVSVTLINVPMQINDRGITVRPTTGDTVNYWFAENPQPGNCLVISNQPYIGYQDSVTKTLLPKEFVIETVGPKSQETKIGMYLDTLARDLYQEKKRRNL